MKRYHLVWPAAQLPSMQALLGLACLTLASLPLAAHEYWLDPETYHLMPDETLAVNIRNGENFVGISYPFDAERYRVLYRLDASGRHALPARLGDYPAIRVDPAEPGLQAVVLTTQPQMLTHDTLEDFTGFLDYHGLGAVQAVHRQRGLPEKNIRERYLRFAKTLVDVSVEAGQGNAAGTTAARPQGKTIPIDTSLASVLAAQELEFELVALESPYAAGRTLDLALLFTGRQLADAQVEVFFDEGAGEARRMLYRTDARGEVSIPVEAAGKYLVNAVQVIRPRAGSGLAHWQSLWASLTFEIDGANSP